MKLIKISAKEAKKLMTKLGLGWGGDGRTFYATNEERTEVWEFDSRAEREHYIALGK